MEEHDIAYLNTLRNQLVRGITTHERRRKRSRLIVRAVAVTATAAVAATTGVTLLGGHGGTASADAAVLRHVRSTLSPTGAVILYEKAITTLDGSRIDYESWQLASPPYSYRRIKGPNESSFNGTTQDSYDAATNTITEQPAPQAPGFDDPVAKLRQLLASGDAHIVAKTTLNGRDVYKISSKSDAAVLNGTIYADANTYAPVRAELPTPTPCPSDSCTGPETIDFLAYQQLPTTADNLKLLSVTALHPQARVVTPARTATETTPTTTPRAKRADKPSTPAATATTTTTTTSGAKRAQKPATPSRTTTTSASY